MSNFMIDTFKIFCDIVDLKSFSRAAEMNFLTQSAVSQQIRNLEKKWKVTLFDRGQRKIAPTKEGELLYREAKGILDSYEKLNLLLNKSTKVLGGAIRVVAIHGVGLHELPPYVKKFLQLYPQVHVNLEYKHDNEIYQQILRKKADLGIVAFPQERPSLNIFSFQKDELAIICAPGHPLAKRKSVPLEKLNGENFIAFQKQLPTRKAVDEHLFKNKVQVKITREFDNIETLKRAIEIGAGLSILAPVSVKNEIQNGTLKMVRISDKPIIRPLGILINKTRTPSTSVMKFMEVLRASRFE